MRISIAEARKALADMINRAACGGERITLLRRGRPAAAIVALRDPELLETLEDQADIAAARAVLADPDQRPIPWAKAKRGGLSRE